MRPKLFSSGGFTLIEILVALVILALAIGAIVPSILNQVATGEVNRLLRDINTVEAGAKSFRVDVSRWPGDLEDLQVLPTATDVDIHGVGYPAGLLNKWKGAYLESVTLVEDDSVATAAGGHIDGFTKGTATNGFQLNGEDYLVLTLTGAPSDHFTALDVEVDGEEGAAAGRVHVSSSTLYYLVAPLQ
jgi:prepilin-type N-terminal cleavage/methylation domain-containing protein